MWVYSLSLSPCLESFDVLGIGIGLGAVPFSERANRED